MRKVLPTLFCWLMILVQPFNAFAVNTIGMLSSVGTVLIDNQPAGSATAVFPGDLIETKAKSKAIMASPRQTITLSENSTLRIGDILELQSGVVVVSSAATSLRVNNVTVTATTPSKFLARRLNGSLEVLALEGSVLVSDGQQTTQVPATRGVSIGSLGKHLSWLRNDDIGILIVVAAAITAGVTLGIVNAQNAKPVTPSAP